MWEKGKKELKKGAAAVRRRLTMRKISNFLLILYVVSLVPLFLIARYNYPSADDYSIGETCRQAWVSTHSFLQVIWQAVLMAVRDYFHWMGYFVSIFLMSIHPGVFGEQYYALTTYIMVGMLSFSTAYFLKALLVKVLKVDRYLCRCISLLVLLITVQCMVGRVEAFYWFCGAVNYMFLYSVELFMLGAMISSLYDRPRRRVFDLIAASVCGVMVGGGNYMTALNVAIVLTVWLASLGVRRKLGRNRALIVPAACFALAFLASVLAPGNKVREASAAGMGAVKSVLVSLYYCLDYVVNEWTSWVVLAGLFLLIPFLWKAAKQSGFSFPCPLVVVMFAYGLVSSLITPPLYAVGNIMAGRLQSIIFAEYILAVALSIGYCLGWAAVRLNRKEIEGEERILSPNTFLAAGFAALFLLFGSVMSVAADPYFFTSTSAVADLSNGTAKAYGEEWEHRVELFHNRRVENVVLAPLPATPQLLYYSDFTADHEAWENRAAARYYGKTSVVIDVDEGRAVKGRH